MILSQCRVGTQSELQLESCGDSNRIKTWQMRFQVARGMKLEKVENHCLQVWEPIEILEICENHKDLHICKYVSYVFTEFRGICV